MAARLTILFILVVALAACAPQSRFPTIDKKLAEAEARKQRIVALETQLRHSERLQSIAYAVLNDNAELCGERVRNGMGFLAHRLQDYDEEWREVAKSHFGLDEHRLVYAVFKGSDAEAAGMAKGDRILRVDKPSPGAGNAGQGGGDQVTLTLDRKGDTVKIVSRRNLVCDYPVTLVRDDSVNAFADGNGIHMSTGMLRFAETDAELALVIGHELAHNTRGHIQAKQGNALLGALLGVGLSVAIGVNVAELGAQLGASAFSQDFEAEADYVGVYHAARAGYDVGPAASFWRRLGAEHPTAIHLLGSTHPSTAKRFLAVEQAVEEFQMKKAKGLPLVPEERNSDKAS